MITPFEMDRSTLRELSSRVHLKAFRDVPPNDIIPFFRRGTRKEIVLFTSVPRPLERRACTTFVIIYRQGRGDTNHALSAVRWRHFATRGRIRHEFSES
ncbi:hypothetical protein TNCV_4021131 [Trichonephila clavipes]|nr:hypothetical protein TNCV_4021131 [Trichonephila clavipes]